MEPSFIIGAILICAIVLIVFKSLSTLFKVILNIIGGAIVLYLFNIIGANFGLVIVINPLTCFLTGFFGLPAVIVLILLKLFI
ncbi:inhibitor of the pro-sigma K processing machinery [Anaerosphaera aminiphila DSM 21120]|uniref:Inhibitor of the pro-sigma K processing machinery n=1 Tax=Anaerosphaera aminiphila DSM 21120 TaxID=1120995 RepID=A0A1M5UST0_9FIRM|nr:pro-sigmaK processing inhibitor BofA family protein [Anaerosphaera aminiphila]SHH66102.1 inhibitor of the pro-sigma K processing machinery [Anaerosphaera aminiphila DSM 21120]